MSKKQETVGYDRIEDSTADTVVHGQVDWSNDSPSLAVIETLAEARNVSPLELDQSLYDVVDPDALDALFQESDGLTSGHVRFNVGDAEVTVTADGDVYVRVLG